VDKRQNTAEDSDLIKASQGGDETAFAHLVERYKEVVFATVVAITGHFDEAKDLSQEVFLRAWFGMSNLKEDASFAGWLRSIARNRAKSWLEHRMRQPPQENVDLHQIADSADSPEQNAEKAERRQLVLATLEKLPEGSRQVLVLHYMEALSTPQIAAQLDLSEAAVRQRLRRARQQMQNEVEDMMADVIKEEAPGTDFSEQVSSLLKRAKGLFQQVHYDKAAPPLEHARELAPTDSLVSMLLADAYTFARSPEDLEENRAAYDRALALLDEVVEREPDNTLALLRRSAVRSILAPEEEVITEQKAILAGAHGGPYEAVAELELARRHLTRNMGTQALKIYQGLHKKHAWLACVLHSEMGVAYAMTEDGAKAIKHFERAVELTTPEAMATLQETSERLIGPDYWAFWSNVDNIPVRQCQNHAWLAGLWSMCGQMDKARQHLLASLQYLHHDDVGAAVDVLKGQFVQQMEQMFPALAIEPEVQELRREVEAV